MTEFLETLEELDELEEIEADPVLSEYPENYQMPSWPPKPKVV